MTDRQPRIFTAPNLLSVSRAFLLIPILICLKHDHILGAFLLMGIGAVTDFLDGFVARRSKVVSSFGKVLDPVSDKIAIGSLMVYLVAFEGLPWWFLATLVGRDLSIIASAAFLMSAHKKAFQANFSGKVSINLIALTIILYLLNWMPYKNYAMWAAYVVMVLSWVRYLRVYFIYLKIHIRRKKGSQTYA
ncbi:MAG: CDP-alcohol phosphatidyltransferase family protein [Candidatus Marinimicrobia bacterium]|nr:CDP-alcohol phosphatidyltransferase family protein [Candidatus Neomarinimicrobiota bacterium]MCF7830155.1 CDP-alcohol phosphatidyltransferase family protein [Candidatus Neomarinimicrobiota bacterium]MCF7882111.1 CDP-alcohol phosphatidyltransferase family protein [Candidatus Neomarinimicrobiota bacterium]